MEEIGEISRDSIATYGPEALMTKDDIHATLAHLAGLFPHTFALEKHQPHRPLKVGIYSDIVARCPDLNRGKLGTVLNIYTRRVVYLQCVVAARFASTLMAAQPAR